MEDQSLPTIVPCTEFHNVSVDAELEFGKYSQTQS